MSPLDFLISPAAAQAAAPAAAGNPMGQFLLMGAVFLGMYFLMIRPQMKRAKEHKEMIGKIAKGDEVITSGGIAGRVDDIGESFITVEIADGLRVKLQKGAITAVLPKGTLKSA
jgi:preprotein translocase subunit YajC